MAEGRQILSLIRNAPASPVHNARVEVNVDAVGGNIGWVNIYEDEQILFGGTGDDLIFNQQVGFIEYTAPDDQAAPYSVKAIRITSMNAGEDLFRETSFEPIEVEGGATLRFTEIKKVLVDE